MDAAVFLYIITAGYNASQVTRRIEMPSLEACNTAIASGKIGLPQSASENENVVVMVCGGELEEQAYFNDGRTVWRKVRR